MFSKIPKEKDESDNEAEITPSLKAINPNFNLDNLLQNGDSASVSSFRSSSSSLYRGNHRRRRAATTQLRGMENADDGSIAKIHGIENSRHHNRHAVRNSRFVEMMARNFRPIFIVLLIIVFWGPMLLQSTQKIGSNRRNVLPPTNLRNRRVSENNNIVVEEKIIRSDLEEEEKEELSLSNPVLNALRAVKNSEFVLPEREEEVKEEFKLPEREKEEFNPGLISEEEREELQIPLDLAMKWDTDKEKNKDFDNYDNEETIHDYHDQEQHFEYGKDRQEYDLSDTQQHRIPHARNLPNFTAYTRAEKPKLIPQHFQDSFADVWEPILPTDTPLFWHIPKNGGTTVGDILTHCVQLVTASNIGATEGHDSEDELKVRTYLDQGKYVNVNTATIPGIKRAKEMGLAASGLADVIEMHRLHEGSELFDPQHRARVFALFRNPVHRAVSMFYYLQRAQWEPTYDPTLREMSLLDYANSRKVEENWVTRFLVHKYTGRLLDDHVEEAKQVMRDKMIVGILDENIQDSLKRFELYFDWWEFNKRKGDAGRVVQCQENRGRTAENKVRHPIPDKNDPAYQRLLQLNWADMKLYRYAEELFREQAVFVKHKDASIEDE